MIGSRDSDEVWDYLTLSTRVLCLMPVRWYGNKWFKLKGVTLIFYSLRHSR